MGTGPVSPVARERLALRPLLDGTVRITGGIWAARQLLNREVTIPYGMEMLEESGTIENLRIAAGRSRAEYRLPLFRDSDLYKLLEAIAWERSHGSEAHQEKFFASSIDVIAAAQEPDGYLNSFVQVVEKGRRFVNPAMGHELYCAGHLMQASVADTRTRGIPGPFADIANRFAALLVQVLPSEYDKYVPGHPEIETALVELYRTNGDHRLVSLAADLIARRGYGSLRWHTFGPSYFQDDVPFAEATTIRGHAVRALYLLAGATDLYTETGGSRLWSSILAQWRDMVSAKTHLTGGIGSRHEDEAFGAAYELPPDHAYCETCAAIASIMWNWRLLLLTGDAIYGELIERTLYNGFLSSLGLDGKSFFYQNPLQCREPSMRQAWYDCACCPPNVMRLLASLDHYVATRTDEGLQVHQYVSGHVRAEYGSAGALELTISTAYPSSGTVSVRVEAAPTESLEITLRIPSWVAEASCKLNGRSISAKPCEKGYVRLREQWSAGDEIELELPMPARVVGAANEIDGLRGCVAFERGPLVYCLEGADLPQGADLRTVSVGAPTRVREEQNVDIAGETVVALRLDGRVHQARSKAGWPYDELNPGADGLTWPVEGAIDLRATPYYAWGNRGATTMRVWIPTTSPTEKS